MRRHDVALAAFLISAAVAPAARSQPPQGPAPVVVSAVVERQVAEQGTFVATVMPLRRSVVGSAVDGRVLELAVNEGDRVAARQPLAQLRTKTLEIELAGAKAELDLRTEELAELESGSRPSEIAEARAKALAARAIMEFAAAKYKRNAALHAQGKAISEEDVEDARSRAAQTNQLYEAAREAYNLVVEGPRKEKIAQAKARVAVQREIVAQVEDRIAKYTIRAPFDGFVVAEHTEVGEWITSGDPVAEVVQLDRVEIQVFVPEESVAYMRVGMPARVSLSALPGKSYTGQVAYIVPQADVRSRTFPVKVHLENPKQGDGHLIKSGMLARVQLTTGRQQQALLVHKDALVLGGRKTTVFVVDVDSRSRQTGKVRSVSVEPGVAIGNLIQVTGSLKKGERVVVEGNERLRAGQPVRIAKTVPVDGDDGSALP